MGEAAVRRCGWADGAPDCRAYHDTEWGVPEYDGRALFEILALESFQAGLSWRTILRKRAAFRAAFAGFDPDVIAGWGAREVARLLADPGIVRHRGKIEATLANARAWQAIEARHGVSAFLWDRVGGVPLPNAWARDADVPAQTHLSVQLSADLRAAGLRFVGPTVCYAFMQAAGLVNDHILSCPRHAQVAALARKPG
jgi:DNA-3-methyladenine glycosylase I